MTYTRPRNIKNGIYSLKSSTVFNVNRNTCNTSKEKSVSHLFGEDEKLYNCQLYLLYNCKYNNNNGIDHFLFSKIYIILLAAIVLI